MKEAEHPTQTRQPVKPLVIRNARVMTASRRGDDPLGIIERGAIVVQGQAIEWVGEEVALAAVGFRNARVVDAGGQLVTPGLVDCHTHLPFAGDRAGEFGMRARGASYLEIAVAGGGIAATVAATRRATTDELVELVVARATDALTQGITSIEAKTGYDLTLPGEGRLLDVIAAAQHRCKSRLFATLLAHVPPPELRDDAAGRAAWVEKFASLLIPAVAAAKAASAVDVYCDEGAFTLDEARTILTAGKRAGLTVRGHVGQFRDVGGAELLAELGGASVEHLEECSDEGIAALAAAGTVAVMIPTACVQLRQKPPRVDRLRAAGVAMAIATDCNPGTSYCNGLAVPMWLATTHYGMSIEEAWLGVTAHAARALGRTDRGQVAPGMVADLAIWDTREPATMCYRIGGVRPAHMFIGGRAIVLPR